MRILPETLQQQASIGRAVIIAASLLVLSGCMASTVGDLNVADSATPPGQATSEQASAADPAQAASVSSGKSDEDYTDPAVVSSSERQEAAEVGENPAPASGQPTGIVMQQTGINASQTSIFSTRGPTPEPQPEATPQGDVIQVPAYAPVSEITPALKSVYSANLPAPEDPAPGDPALEDGAESAPATAAETISVADPADALTTSAVAASVVPADAATATPQPVSDAGKPEPRKQMTLAAFFAGKRKAKGKVDGEAAPEGLDTPRKTISIKRAAGLQQASLSARDLPGVTVNSLTDFEEPHEDEDEDSSPAGLMKLASLSGMTRVAPNGIVLQTENVDVGCFKPEMVRAIRSIEVYYDRPAIVTSGYRPQKRNQLAGGRRHSFHTTCDAADIQIKGVSKWELASYLRSRPDRGGVGTYCHTESVHLDLGAPRDWNWRCRRARKK